MASAMPPNWAEWKTDSGEAYYHNSVTNVTQWDRPVAASQPAPPNAENVFTYMPTASELEAPARQAEKPAAAAPAAWDAELVSLTEDQAVIGGRASFVQEAAPAAMGAQVAAAGLKLSGFTGGGFTGAAAENFEGMTGWMLSTAQRLFDVSTDDVVRRLRLAMKPYPPPSDLAREELMHRPDLYGPFWVATTAVLFLAATGNFARMLEWDSEAAGGHAFRADYSLVGVAASMIYGSLIVVPAAVKGCMMIAAEEKEAMDVQHLLCVCGYSLAPAIPVSLLCLLPFALLRWLFVLGGLACSLLFVREHLLSNLDVDTPWLRTALLGAPCVTPIAVFLWYRLHFFSSAL